MLFKYYYSLSLLHYCFQIYSSIRRRLHDRLMYILCSQNWEAMGAHYWIKQCIELLFSTVAGKIIKHIMIFFIIKLIFHFYTDI